MRKILILAVCMIAFPVMSQEFDYVDSMMRALSDIRRIRNSGHPWEMQTDAPFLYYVRNDSGRRISQVRFRLEGQDWSQNAICCEGVDWWLNDNDDARQFQAFEGVRDSNSVKYSAPYGSAGGGSTVSKVKVGVGSGHSRYIDMKIVWKDGKSEIYKVKGEALKFKIYRGGVRVCLGMDADAQEIYSEMKRPFSTARNDGLSRRLLPASAPSGGSGKASMEDAGGFSGAKRVGFLGLILFVAVLLVKGGALADWVSGKISKRVVEHRLAADKASSAAGKAEEAGVWGEERAVSDDEKESREIMEATEVELSRKFDEERLPDFGIYEDVGAASFVLKREVLTVERFREKIAAAKAGDIAAQMIVAAEYDHPAALSQLHARPNRKVAFQWWMAAAEAGNAEAMLKVADHYSSGSGCGGENAEKAFEWTLKSAENGYADAKAAIARRYYMGWGCLPDYKAAFRWCRDAVESGCPYAIRDLAEYYRDGVGCARDLKKMWRCIQEGVRLGDQGSDLLSAECLMSGVGCSKSEDVAFSIYLRLVEKESQNQYFLSLLEQAYERGFGTPGDRQRASQFVSAIV